MNTKKRKITIMISTVAVIMLFTASFAFAATGGYGGGYVSPGKDMQSRPIVKNQTSSACFNITNYSGDGYCTIWVESESGANLTNKETYGATRGKTFLDYSGGASSLRGDSVHLNVSTSFTTVHDQFIQGRWSPDNVTL